MRKTFNQVVGEGHDFNQPENLFPFHPNLDESTQSKPEVECINSLTLAFISAYALGQLNTFKN